MRATGDSDEGAAVHSSSRYEQARRSLSEEVKKQGLSDPEVLRAIATVPRHQFVKPDFVNLAYKNCSLPIDCKQTISQPYIVALMTQSLLAAQLKVKKVLEIGTGCGYQTAILAELGLRVFTVERIAALHASAKRRLQEMSYDAVHYRCADGSRGWAKCAPYDGIMVTAACPQPPKALLRQLKVGGRLIIPVGGSGTQTLLCVDRHRFRYQETRLESVRFVQLLSP